MDSWLASGFVGFDVYPARLFKSNKGELELSDYKYFNVKVKGHCELDFAQMNVKILKECRTCGNATYNKDTWEFGETKIKHHTWDNSHIFVAKGFEFAPLCKEDVLENVYNNKFSNFRFIRLNDMFSLSSVDIDLQLKFK